MVLLRYALRYFFCLKINELHPQKKCNLILRLNMIWKLRDHGVLGSFAKHKLNME